jgi:hypothetical protein
LSSRRSPPAAFLARYCRVSICHSPISLPDLHLGKVCHGPRAKGISFYAVPLVFDFSGCARSPNGVSNVPWLRPGGREHTYADRHTETTHLAPDAYRSSPELSLTSPANAR